MSNTNNIKSLTSKFAVVVLNLNRPVNPERRRLIRGKNDLQILICKPPGVNIIFLFFQGAISLNKFFKQVLKDGIRKFKIRLVNSDLMSKIQDRKCWLCDRKLKNLTRLVMLTSAYKNIRYGNIDTITSSASYYRRKLVER